MIVVSFKVGQHVIVFIQVLSFFPISKWQFGFSICARLLSAWVCLVALFWADFPESVTLICVNASFISCCFHISPYVYRCESFLFILLWGWASHICKLLFKLFCNFSHFFFFFSPLCMCAPEYVYAHQSMYVEVRGQFSEIDSFSPTWVSGTELTLSGLCSQHSDHLVCSIISSVYILCVFLLPFF